MPSKIRLQDAISQCGEEIIETIKDSISPLSETPFAKQIITDLNEDLSLNPFLQFRLAPSIVCRSELELYSIYMPRFGIRFDLGGREGLGFLTFRRSKLLQKELESAYEDDPKILSKLKVANNSRYGKLADSVIRIPEVCTRISFKSPHLINFWNVMQAELFKHYGGEDSDKGVPFVTHSDSSGGMCAQACIFMLEMYHIDNLDRINGIADITYLAGTTSTHIKNTNSISLKGLTPQSVYDYLINNFINNCQHILSVHNLPDRYRSNHNKGPFGHLKDSFSDLGEDADLNEKVIQKIEVEAYARSLIPQIALVDLGLLYDDKTQPTPEFPDEPNKRRPHAILIIGTKYCVDKETGRIKEEFVLNDPATGPLRVIDTKHNLVDCARYHDQADGKQKMVPPAFESLTILPQGMTRHLAPKQSDSIPGLVNRIKPIKHFTIGILEDLQQQQDLVTDTDDLKKLILMAIQFSTDEKSRLRYENTLYALAASALSKLKIDVRNISNKMIVKDIYTFIGNKLKGFKENLNASEMRFPNWYWLLCIPRLKKGKQIQIHLRLYDASDNTVLTQSDELKALEKEVFSINL